MATFGNTSSTTDLSQTLKNTITAGKFTLSEDGTATSMTANITHSGAAKSYKCLIYRSDNTLIAETETLTSPSTGWVTFNFKSIINLVAGDYYLCCWSSSATGFANINVVDGAGSGGTQAATFATSPPITYTGGDAGTALLLIYCTYTPGLTKMIGNSVNNSSGSSYGVEGVIVGGRYTMPAEEGIPLTIGVRLNSSGAPSDLQVKCLIYRYSTLALVAISEERTFTTALGDWEHFDIITVNANLQPSTEYIICVWAEDDASNVHSILYNSSLGSGSERDAQTYGTPPDPMVPTVHDTDDAVCIYVTYGVVISGQPIEFRKKGTPGATNKPIFGRGW